MKEHPIPQDITSYRFHIVGNMTLKQFLEIAVGIVLAIIMYKTGLPGIIKWPFVVLFAGVGAGAAFLPIAERPLDHWILTYFKVMFKPTKFYWHKIPKVPDLFSYQPNENASNDSPEINIAPLKRKRVGEYVASIPANKEKGDEELEKVSDVLKYFNQPAVETVAFVPQKPITNKVANLAKLLDQQDQVTKTPPNKTGSPSLSKNMHDQSGSVVVRHNQVLSFSSKKEEKESTQQQLTNNEQATPQVFFDAQTLEKTTPQLTPTPATVAQPIEGELGAGVFNTKLPFPQNPTQPNLLVGMVLNQRDEMIPGAILEIKNQSGRVERAIKSNALGQFFVTTPLKPNTYTITVEAEGYSFEPFVFATNNTILPPLEVRSIS